MPYLKDTIYYKEAIQELNYSFGNFYLFDGFILGEINEGVTFSWDDHAKKLAEEYSDLYESNGEGIVYISNRVNSYAVRPTDWLKFYKNSYDLRGYAVVTPSKKRHKNPLLERLFMKSSLRTFDELSNAISWAKEMSCVKVKVA